MATKKAVLRVGSMAGCSVSKKVEVMDQKMAVDLVVNLADCSVALRVGKLDDSLVKMKVAMWTESTDESLALTMAELKEAS